MFQSLSQRLRDYDSECEMSESTTVPLCRSLQTCHLWAASGGARVGHGCFLPARSTVSSCEWTWCYIDDGGASRVPYPAYVLKRCQRLDEAPNWALNETTIFGPVSSRNIVFAKVVIVEISSNHVGTRKPSTKLSDMITLGNLVLWTHGTRSAPVT